MNNCPKVPVEQFVKLRIDRAQEIFQPKNLLHSHDESVARPSGRLPLPGPPDDTNMAIASSDESDGPRHSTRKSITPNDKGKARASLMDLANEPPFDIDQYPELTSEVSIFNTNMPHSAGSSQGSSLLHAGPSKASASLGTGRTGLLTEAALRPLPIPKQEVLQQLTRVMWVGLPLKSLGDKFDIPGNGIGGMNPWSAEFNAEYFRSAGGYLQCPYQSCRKLLTAPDKLRAHMKTGNHARWAVRCPYCYREYGTAAQLVAHFELASSRCKIKDQPWFPQVMEIVSSGFVGHDFLGSELGHRLRAQRPTELN